MSILDEYRVRADMRKQWRTASPNVDRCRDDAEKLLSALDHVREVAYTSDVDFESDVVEALT